MSDTRNIFLPGLPITRIKNNYVKTELNSLSNENQKLILGLFSRIKDKYVGKLDHYNGVYFPLRYIKDPIMGLIVQDSYYLLLRNTPKSKYYENGRQVSFQTLLKKYHSGNQITITAYIDFTYLRRSKKIAYYANITEANLETSTKQEMPNNYKRRRIPLIITTPDLSDEEENQCPCCQPSTNNDQLASCLIKENAHLMTLLENCYLEPI